MPLHDLDWGGTYTRELTSFLYQWSAAVSDALNSQLPKGDERFIAELSCQTRLKLVESIRGFEHGPPSIYTADGHDTGLKYPSFEPGPASFTAPARFTDRIGVNVIDHLEGRSVGAAILFVSADNKESSDASLAFAIRAAAWMSAGVGVVVVDIAPGPASWATHLHSLTGVFPISRRHGKAVCPILVVHPAVKNDVEQYSVWHHDVAFGNPLPTVTVPIRGQMHLKLDLETTYSDACERSRLP